MKKFKLNGTNGRFITGFYLGVQLVNSIKLDYTTFHREKPEIIEDQNLILMYYDDDGCIWTEKIDLGDQIEFL